MAPRRTSKLTAHTPVRRYGWRPDLPDQRDLTYSARAPSLPFPPSLRTLPIGWPAVEDQLDMGACTGYGCEFLHRVAGGTFTSPGSRLFIYWNERQIEGTLSEDAGAQIRTGMKVMASLGVPPEPLWPYSARAFARRPTQKAFAAAKKRQALRYGRVPRTLEALKGALQARHPVVFGFTVYESFEAERVARTGLMSVPKKSERNLGGHCTVAVGWDDTVLCPGASAPGAVLVRNSWGPAWGIHDPAEPHLAGHFWMPYEVFLNADITDDLWALFEVELAAS